jgi:hypothetical protein
MDQRRSVWHIIGMPDQSRTLHSSDRNDKILFISVISYNFTQSVSATEGGLRVHLVGAQICLTNFLTPWQCFGYLLVGC